MLNNLAIGLARQRRIGPFLEVVRHRLAVQQPDDFSVRFELWHALFELPKIAKRPRRNFPHNFMRTN
jgi:hypothetical protein